MSSTTLNQRYAIGSTQDILTQSATPLYKLGTQITLYSEDGKAVTKWIYCKSHGTLVQYGAYIVNQSGTAGSEVITSTPATSDDIYVLPCVSPIDVTSGYYAWMQIQGLCTYNETGSTTATHAVKLANSVATGTTEAGTTRSVNTIGFNKSGGSGATTATIVLIGMGNRVTIS